MSNEPYFDQIEQSINLLITEGKFEDAYDKCKNTLLKFPDEARFKKLKTQIEEEVIESNDKLIEKELSEIKPLWKEEKYAEILNKLSPLLKISTNNKKLNNEIVKAQEAYKDKSSKNKAEFTKEQTKKLDDLLENDTDKLLQELFALEMGNKGNKIVLTMTKDYRDKLIRKKIKAKSDLLSSDKFEDIQNFIDQLKRIDDKNPQIKKLEGKTTEGKHSTQLGEKKDFLYRSLTHLDTLMRLRKWDKAVKVAEEILEIDENNSKVKKLHAKAERKLFAQTKTETAKIIESEYKELKEEYEKDRSKFVKI